MKAYTIKFNCINTVSYCGNIYGDREGAFVEVREEKEEPTPVILEN